MSVETDIDSEDTEETEQDEPGEKPIRPKTRNEPEDPNANYKVFTKRARRRDRRRKSCATAKSWRACAPISISS